MWYMYFSTLYFWSILFLDNLQINFTSITFKLNTFHKLFVILILSLIHLSLDLIYLETHSSFRINETIR